MYAALYDLAEKQVAHVDEKEATKNPESYAWIGAASHLSVFGTAHQDWSLGACRDGGSPAQTVTVIRGQNVPRQTMA